MSDSVESLKGLIPSQLTDLVATLVPETLKLEISGALAVVVLIALWIWRNVPKGPKNKP